MIKKLFSVRYLFTSIRRKVKKKEEESNILDRDKKEERRF
jgi:hypothetical protein